MGLMPVQTPDRETGPDAARPALHPQTTQFCSTPYVRVQFADVIPRHGLCHLLLPPSASYLSHLFALAIVFATANLRRIGYRRSCVRY